MKNVGVAAAPTVAASFWSLGDAPCCRVMSRSRLELGRRRGRAPGRTSRRSRPVERLLVGEQLSCIAQNFPCRRRPRPPSAAGSAFGGRQRLVLPRRCRTLPGRPVRSAQRRLDTATERALKVGELDDGHLGVGRSLHRPFERHPDAIDAVARPLSGRHRCRRGSGSRCPCHALPGARGRIRLPAPPATMPIRFLCS